ncbi:hypothetical protein KC19_5G095400 [Ceratodon purpureus]|uniref:Uncharacterized protein n=1 Tax=Ceratodon purpureus TaxID=3225 RepID=A0A8T0I144_CERPU|nr:hypothetical protein KC19_5G095400 [Ceratodon purpureus]
MTLAMQRPRTWTTDRISPTKFAHPSVQLTSSPRTNRDIQLVGFGLVVPAMAISKPPLRGNLFNCERIQLLLRAITDPDYLITYIISIKTSFKLYPTTLCLDKLYMP